MKKKEELLGPKEIALGSAFAAAVAVGTIMISIPVGLGYLNFGEIFIYIAAFLFGGIVGGIAGGVGAAAADVILGWAFYAPITLAVKGIEGFLVGKISGKTVKSKLLGVCAGAPVMIGGYTLARAYLEGIPAALFQELPIDILQAAVGAGIGIPVSQALKSKIPELSEI
ncbi:MAG: ECF transporter S component [Candidatus Hadarchaeia archaeon]